MIPGSWERAPRWTPCWAQSLLETLFLSPFDPLPDLCSLSFSLRRGEEGRGRLPEGEGAGEEGGVGGEGGGERKGRGEGRRGRGEDDEETPVVSSRRNDKHSVNSYSVTLN